MYAIAFHPNYVYPIPDHHRFPMEKYRLLPQQLMHQGIVTAEQFFEPGLVDVKHVIAVHDADYIHRFLQQELTYHEVRRIGFEPSNLLVERELTLVQGTIEGAKRALQDGIAFNIAGGTHHACYAHGEGFCMINDQAVAAQYLINTGLAQRVLIVDLDVHQGNGTADLLGQSEAIFTFSMHCEKNYPFIKAKSHLDVGLEMGTEDATYLSLLKQHYYGLLDSFQPDFIFYQAGVDILSTDKMGKLACTLSGCLQRDEMVIGAAFQRDIPMQVSMGGGYSPAIKTILDAHTQTFTVANRYFY